MMLLTRRPLTCPSGRRGKTLGVIRTMRAHTRANIFSITFFWRGRTGMNNNKNNGSALIFILIAIVLLGGLTYVLSKTSSNTEETGSVERASIQASQIMSYGGALKQSIDAMMSRGCSENDLNFNDSSLTGYANGNAPANESCDVFSAKGGAARLSFFPDTAAPPSVTSGYTVLNVGTAKTELLYLYPVSREICMAINRTLGIPNNGTEGPPSDELDNGSKFTGAYTDAGGTATEEIDNVEFDGKKAGCAHQSGSGSSAIFQYYQVLLAR